MMKRYVVSIVLMLFMSIQVFAQPETKTNQTDDNGRKQGRWLEKAGEIIMDGQYQDNLKHGQWLVHFAETGLLSKLETFSMGKKNGIFLEISKQGYLVSEKYFINDLPEGPHKVYGQGGFQVLEKNYKDGKFHGVQITYYENSKKKSEESYYSDGVKDGPSKWYNSDGMLIAEYKYVKGMLQGEQKSFYSGNKIRTSETYRDNLNDGPSIEYFENGNVKISGQYKAGLQDGKWIEYDEQGVIVKTTLYSGGKEKK
ncbi:MAG: toxin-antitoxin system YwqK family antitoxin [Bacteroidota bacterium]